MINKTDPLREDVEGIGQKIELLGDFGSMPSAPSVSHLCDQVKALVRLLSGLSVSLAADPLDANAIQQQQFQLQRQFQDILATVASADIDPAVEQQLRPHQTEAHRRLRLLGIEAMRLRTAKQPATLERQRSQLQTHLSELQKFVQAIADQVCT
ncbi:MAG: heterocyst frequency control protein PatD [Phormidesmis sp.]|jgi:hypothetical protein